jgi:hypothetical protein
MNSIKINLSSNTLSADISTVLSATPIKGRTRLILDLTGFDESQYTVNDLKINWGDVNLTYEYKKPPVFDYTKNSIFDEILYGKLNGSIMTQYTHEYNSLSSVDIVTYALEIFVWYENGYRHDITVYLSIYPESYYDSLDEIDIISTQMLPLSTSDTVINLESRRTGQTLICILSGNGDSVNEQVDDVIIPISDSYLLDGLEEPIIDENDSYILT